MKPDYTNLSLPISSHIIVQQKYSFTSFPTSVLPRPRPYRTPLLIDMTSRRLSASYFSGVHIGQFSASTIVVIRSRSLLALPSSKDGQLLMFFPSAQGLVNRNHRLLHVRHMVIFAMHISRYIFLEELLQLILEPTTQ